MSQTTVAQDILRSFSVPNGARTIDLVGDLDGDDLPEILVGADSYSNGRGTAYVLFTASSATNPSFTYVGETRVLLGQKVGAVGDVDGDDLADFGISAQFAPAFIASGKDGSVRYTHSQPAQAFEELGDLDGDGVEDFALSNYGSVDVILGGTFELQRRLSIAGSSNFGYALLALGDVDGDGVIDLAVGAPTTALTDVFPGKVYVFSLATGQPMYFVQGLGSADWFGSTIAASGDLNGNGVEDFVVGAFTCCGTAEFGGPGRVFYFDGEAGVVLQELRPPASSHSFGSFVLEVGDLNGNGSKDVLVTRSEVFGSWNDVLDGIDHQSFWTVHNSSAARVGRGQDWNDDGFPDIVIRLGVTLDVCSGAPAGVTALGKPCGLIRGQAPRIGASDVPFLGTEVRVHLSGVLPDKEATLLVSVGSAPSARRGRGLGPCAALLRPDVLFHVRTERLPDGQGTATVGLKIPNDPNLVGSAFIAQWLVRDSDGRETALTRALRFEIRAP